MPWRRIVLSSIERMLVTLALSGGAGAGAAGIAEPFTPDDPAIVVERLPVAAFERVVPTDARGLDAVVAEAQRWMGFARRTGDARYLGRAMGVLQKAHLDTLPPAERSLEASLALADLQQLQHEFDAATATLDQVLQRYPDHGGALLMKAVILQVQGRADSAMAVCLRIPYRYGRLAKATCIAGAQRYTGKAAAGYRDLRDAFYAATTHDEPLLGWSMRLLAELAEINGDPIFADTVLHEAVRRDPDDIRNRLALADLLLRVGDAQQVMAVTEMASPPPMVLIRRAIAARQLGLPAATALQDQVTVYLDAMAQRGDTLHLREVANAELDLFERPRKALRHALDNWRRQREFADTHAVLAAAAAVGDRSAAAQVLLWLDDNANRDSRLMPLRRALAGGRDDV